MSGYFKQPLILSDILYIVRKKLKLQPIMAHRPVCRQRSPETLNPVLSISMKLSESSKKRETKFGGESRKGMLRKG